MNIDEFIPRHLLIVVILGAVAVALLITLFILIKVSKNKKAKTRRTSKYPLVQKLLLKTEFNFTIREKDSFEQACLIRATYRCFGYCITYHFYVPNDNNYLKAAKQKVNELIKDDTLCTYTLSIIPYKEFKRYATC